MSAYDNATTEAVMLNGMRALTLNDSVSTWPTCFACALADRSFNYTSSNRSSERQSCFITWCWHGVDNPTTPIEYEPVLGTAPGVLDVAELDPCGYVYFRGGSDECGNRFGSGGGEFRMGNREGMVEFISGGGDDGDRRDDSVGMRRLDDLTEVI